MDERRFRAALEAVAKTIHSYGEDEIFAALGVIAERFGWELSKRDPGPDVDGPEREVSMYHEGGATIIGIRPESDNELFARAFRVPAFPSRWA